MMDDKVVENIKRFLEIWPKSAVKDFAEVITPEQLQVWMNVANDEWEVT